MGPVSVVMGGALSTGGAITASGAVSGSSLTATSGGATVAGGLIVSGGGANISGKTTITGNLTVTGSFMDLSSEYREHIGGSTTWTYDERTNLGSTTNRVCFMTGYFRDNNTNSVGCRIVERSGTWYLEGRRGGSLDIDCYARCLTWN